MESKSASLFWFAVSSLKIRQSPWGEDKHEGGQELLPTSNRQLILN